jgi:hypothetical protein
VNSSILRGLRIVFSSSHLKALDKGSRVFLEGGAQIELGPCGPKQVILLTERGRRSAED